MNQWTEYQPHCNRPKKVHDIRLRDGSELLGFYPNADSWHSIQNEYPPRFRKIKDYRVTHIRLSEKQFV